MGSPSVRATGSGLPIHQPAAPTATPSARPSANALNPLGYFLLLGMITMTISGKMLKNKPSPPAERVAPLYPRYDSAHDCGDDAADCDEYSLIPFRMKPAASGLSCAAKYQPVQHGISSVLGVA
jgi:hypothetical protein